MMRINKKMTSSFLFSSLFLTSAAFAQLAPITYDEAKGRIENPSEPVKTVLQESPEIYSFYNSDGNETVVYTGQTFRQVLINDAKLVADTLERGGKYAGDVESATAVLDSFFRYNAIQQPLAEDAVWGRSRHLVQPKNVNGQKLGVKEGARYSNIFRAGTSLQAKLAGIDNDLRKGELIGWDSPTVEGQPIDADGDGVKTPEEFVDALFKVVANNAANESSFLAQPAAGVDNGEEIRRATVTQSALDLSQLMQKFYHSAVSFSQGAGDYLSVDLPGDGKGLKADNSQQYVADDGTVRPFTVLAHHWDEAFGYYGAARDYANYELEEIRLQQSLDSFHQKDQTHGQGGDGSISLAWEKNFALSVNAAKRDVGSGNETQLTQTVFDAFLKGRQLIHEKPEGYMDYVQAYAVFAAVEWEKVIAATVIHYVNETIADLQAFHDASLAGTDKAYQFSNLAKHFSEMKGFAFAFQFSPVSLMSDDDNRQLHSLIGETPELPGAGVVLTEAYVAKLEEARELLKIVYFTESKTTKEW